MIRFAQDLALPIDGTGASFLGNLYTILHRNLVLSTNNLVASRRGEGSNRIVGIHVNWLELAVDAAMKAMNGPRNFASDQAGHQEPTDDQQVKAGYLGAIAFVNTADHEERVGGEYCFRARQYLRAASGYFQGPEIGQPIRAFAIRSLWSWRRLISV
jgi:hypothetical protein